MNFETSIVKSLNHWGAHHAGLVKFVANDFVYLAILLGVLTFLYIEIVNANAPITPSIEKVASRISKYKILLQAEAWLDKSSFSFASAFFLNPSVIKNAIDPMAADKAKIGFTFTEK